jgi:hypothetical protein
MSTSTRRNSSDEDAAAKTKCGQRDLSGKYVCGKPKGHLGPHVAVLYGGNTVVGWGGTT